MCGRHASCSARSLPLQYNPLAPIRGPQLGSSPLERTCAMWNDTKFDLTRREIRTTRPFDQVVAAIEAQAPVVVPETNHVLLGSETVAAINAGRMHTDHLQRQRAR